MNTLQTKLARQSASHETLARNIIKRPGSLHEAFEGLGADEARVKYGCLKVLRIISEKQPAVLYPEFDRLFSLLDSDNNIFKWGAILCIGNLAAVDSEGKIDRNLDKYLQPISGHVMITAANVIVGAGKIAQAKPHLAEKITRALLRVEKANYQTEECRNMALGHAVASLDLFFEHLEKPQPVVEFVKRQLHNRRNAVKMKAAKFLNKYA
jgi:hypothetical protein